MIPVEIVYDPTQPWWRRRWTGRFVLNVGHSRPVRAWTERGCWLQLARQHTGTRIGIRD